MDEPSRQKRAKEAGWGGATYYHGTDVDIKEFDLNHPRRRDSGWLGTGVYLDTDPDIARTYADEKAFRSLVQSKGKEKLKEEEIITDRGDSLKTAEGKLIGANVIPVKIRLKNPFYASEKLKNAIAEIEEVEGAEVARKWIDSFTEELKQKGHDGVIMSRGDGHQEVVVFDTSDVKSIFSKFNPKYKHSPKLSKASGGLVSKGGSTIVRNPYKYKPKAI
jgi:hypothetical protein